MRLVARDNPHLHISCSSFDCITCKSCKGHKLPFEHSHNKKLAPLELIHSDVWGPSPVTSIQGFHYYVTFIDDCSHFTWLFPLKQKSEVSNVFINFKKLIENQFNYKIRILRTDGGTEYLNNNLSTFLQAQGILHQRSCPYTPDQNGVAERKHRHVLETTRTLLSQASIPHQYWPDATLTDAYLINRLPSQTTGSVSPFQLLHNKAPVYDHLKAFGCECYPLIPNQLRNKLQPKSNPHVFLGYSDQYKGYKCLNRNSNSICISRHVTFSENVFPFRTNIDRTQHQQSETAPSLLIPTSYVQT